jgi:hypothetical protein
VTGVEALVWCVAIVCSTILSLAILATLAGGGRRGGGHHADVPLDELRPLSGGKRGVDSFDVPPPRVVTDPRESVDLLGDFPDEPVSRTTYGGYRPRDGRRRTLDEMSADDLSDD